MASNTIIMAKIYVGTLSKASLKDLSRESLEGIHKDLFTMLKRLTEVADNLEKQCELQSKVLGLKQEEIDAWRKASLGL